MVQQLASFLELIRAFISIKDAQDKKRSDAATYSVKDKHFKTFFLHFRLTFISATAHTLQHLISQQSEIIKPLAPRAKIVYFCA